MKYIKNIAIVISLAISIMSLILSIKSINMNIKEFESSRGLVLKSEATGTRFILLPIDRDQYLQSMSIYFPEDVDVNMLYLTLPNLEIPRQLIELKLHNYLRALINDKMKSMYSGHTKEIYINNIYIPIVVDSLYIARNKNYYNRSMYGLMFNIKVVSGNIVKNGVKIGGIIFFREISKDINSKDLLNNELRSTIEFQLRDPKLLPDI